MRHCECGKRIDMSMEIHLKEEMWKLYDVLERLGYTHEEIQEMKEA